MWGAYLVGDPYLAYLKNMEMVRSCPRLDETRNGSHLERGGEADHWTHGEEH